MSKKEEVVSRGSKSLIRAASEKSGVPYEYAAKVINCFVEEIRRTLLAGTEVTVKNLGRFRLNMVREHNGVNPRTNEPLVIKLATRVRFKCSRELAAQIKPLQTTSRVNGAGLVDLSAAKDGL